MKICYFIQTHKNPEQICRLVKSINQASNNCHILISHDFSTSHLDLSPLNYSNIDVLKRYKPARRGDASILEIYLEAVEHLVQSKIDFDWLVCMSGQDYPIQPVAKFENCLAQTKYDGFLTYFDVFLSQEQITKREEKEKFYFSQYINLPYWSKPILKKLSKLEIFLPFLKVQCFFAMIGFKPRSTPFNDNFRCYWSYHWHMLSKKCLMFLRDYLKTHPEILQYYKRTLAPEESMIASILVNSQRFNLSQNTLLYATYPPILKGFAQTIRAEYIPSLVKQNYYFARKFDLEEDREIFDMLDHLYLSNYQIV